MSRFFSDLKEEIHNELQLFQPNSLTEAITSARKKEMLLKPQRKQIQQYTTAL